MQVARIQRRVLLSADTNFGELLARSKDDGPSVVLFRGHEVEPATMAVTLLANLDQIDELLTAGAIVVILDARIRVRQDVDVCKVVKRRTPVMAVSLRLFRQH